MRGHLNTGIKEAAKAFLGREITVRELRLYPYIDYCLKNWGQIERCRINKEEIAILSNLEKERHLIMNGNVISVKKSFYDYMQQVLWLGYVVEE